MQGQDKRSPRLNLPPPPSPALHTQEAAPTAFWTFLALICTLEELRACSRDRMPGKRVFPGAPRTLFPPSIPGQEKASRFVQGSLAIPGCVMGLQGGGGGPCPALLLLKAGKEALFPPGFPQALDKGYSAHPTDEETEVLKVSQGAQGCWAK